MIQLCGEIGNANTPPLNAWADWIERTFLSTECFNFGYYDRVELARNTEWNQPGTDNGSELKLSSSIFRYNLLQMILVRQWYYYKCTQLGLWEITSPASDLFPHHVRDTYHYYMCNDVLGEA